MTIEYENTMRFRRLMHLCREYHIALEPKPGAKVFYQGQWLSVAHASKDDAALLDECLAIPPAPDDYIIVRMWSDDPEFVLCFNLEMLLQIIFDVSSLYPTLVPGIEETREVWKVQHPNSELPFIFKTPQEALTELAIDLMEKQG